MRGPIRFTRAGHNACKFGHSVRDSGTSVRGSVIVFAACQRVGCDACAIGFQSTELDLTIWFDLTRERYTVLAKTDKTTSALQLLELAGYHEPEKAA